MDLASQIVSRYFATAGSELLIGGAPVSEIARSFGTPAFVYDQGVLEARLGALRAALPASFQISYSVKANPAQEIMRFFVARECGLEIASGGELEQALAAGCPPERIIFAGPGKTVAELDLALRAGIKEIHVESPLEIQRIRDLCRQRGCRAGIALRVNPSAEVQGGAMRMGGKPAPFGIDEESIAPVIAGILDDPRLLFRGIHLFTGTQILDYAVLVAQYRKAIAIARRITADFGCRIHTVDFGGGLGIPYFSGDQFLDLEQLRSELVSLDQEIRADQALAQTEFMVEPGRFLVGEAGIYLARINDIKVSRGKKFLILDGGMNHHLAASGNLGQTIKRNYPVALLNKMSQPAAESSIAENPAVQSPAVETVDVVGPLCTPLDVLARNVALPPAEVGDLFGVFQSGAYARSASPSGFLSHPAPPEILVHQGHAALIRHRGDNAQYLQDQISAEALEQLPARR